MSDKTPKRITVIRAPHDSSRPYFSMSRETAQDRGITFEARGVITYLLSKPPDWEVNPRDLQQLCGRDKVYKILKELIDNRYMLRYMEANKKGQYVKVVYELHERPLTENPDTENPDTVSPDTENTDTNIIESLESIDSTDQEKLPVAPSKNQKAIQPDQPSPPKPPTPYQAFTGAIAEHMFGIDISNKALVDASMGRIGPLASAIRKTHRALMRDDELTPTPEDVKAFVDRWRAEQGDRKGAADVPLGANTVPPHWARLMAPNHKSDEYAGRGLIRSVDELRKVRSGA